MHYLNLYGVDLGEAAMKGKHGFRVEPAPAPGFKTKYIAKITGWREFMNQQLVVAVVDEDGDVKAGTNFQIAVAWPNMDSGRPNLTDDPRYPIAETYSLEECLKGVTIISEGTGNDGPAYRVFVVDADTSVFGEVVSEVAHVGWVGAGHITFCPTFTLYPVGNVPAPTPTPPPTNGWREDAATLRAIAARLEQL